MDENRPDSLNPYQSPEHGPPLLAMENDAGFDTRILRDFRSQSLALGVAWIAFAVIHTGTAIAVASSDSFASPEAAMLALALVGLALAELLTGSAACFKQVWAVRVGLVLSYLGLFLSIVTLNICMLAAMLIIIVQGHRVIALSRQLRAAGVPLSARP